MRKNRTLRAGFLGTTTVMEMLEANYRTWCAQNDVLVEDGPPKINENAGVGMEMDPEPLTVSDEHAGLKHENGEEVEEVVEEEEEWGGIMDVDDPDTPSFFQDELDEKAKMRNSAKAGAGRRRKGRVAELVREKVRKILEDETELADKRARMCDESDFLRLLWAFNKEGIHFS